MRPLHDALRALIRAPLSSGAGLLTLGVALGLITAVFSLINAVWFRAPDVRAPSELRYAYTRAGHDLMGVAYDDTASYADAAESLGLNWCGVTRDDGLIDGSGFKVTGELVTAPCFTLVGVPLSAGRAWAPDDREADTGIVISDRLWAQLFGRSPDAIGRSVRLDGATYTVIGVTAKSFTGTLSAWRASDYWVRVDGRGRHLSEHWSPDWRSRPLFTGVTRVTSRQSESALLAALQAMRPAGMMQRRVDPGDGVVLLSSPAVRLPLDGSKRDAQRVAFLLVLTAGVVLAIACTNVASLFAARAVASERSRAVRLALGAPALTVALQPVTEVLVLTIGAGALGLAMSQALAAALLYQASTALQAGRSATFAFDTSLDWRILLFSAVACLLAALAVAAASARAVRRPDMRSVLADTSSQLVSSSDIGRRARLMLVGQTAAALVLVSFAAHGLLASTRDELRLRHTEAGQVSVVSYELPLPPRSAQTQATMRAYVEDRAALNRRLLQRVSQDGTFTAVALTDALPHDKNRSWVSWDTSTRLHPRQVMPLAVTPGFLDVMRLPLLAGRAFTDADLSTSTSERVIVSKSLATSIADSAPVGSELTFHDPDGSVARTAEIIGVVADSATPGAAQQPAVFLPLRDPRYARHFIGRLQQGRGETGARQVADLVRRLDGRVVLSRSASLRQLVDEFVFPRRFVAVMLSAAAAIAILLATLGLYGATAYTAAGRLRELQLRSALGATRRDLIKMMLGECATTLALGLSCGLLLVWLLAGVARPRYEVPPIEPILLLASTAVLCLVVAGACYLPARRAARANPAALLK